MNEVLLANVFFVITGSAVLVVAAFVCVVCYHAVRLLRVARKTLGRIEDGTEVFFDDLRTFRDRVVSGQIFVKLLTAFTHAIRKDKQPRASSHKRKEIDGSDS